MEVLKAATEWAKAEVFSSQFFIFFGVLFIVASIGFWQMGKTDVAKAFIIPTLVAGALLLMAGLSFFISNKSRLSNFETEYKKDSSAFIQSEIARTEKTIASYTNTAFKVFPVIIMMAALLFIFIDKPTWRAISITTIAFLTIIILIDSHAHPRTEVYHQHLVSAEEQN